MRNLLILLLFPLASFGQTYPNGYSTLEMPMSGSISLFAPRVSYSSGVYKTMPWAYWDNPETDNLVVVLQGSGEFVTDLNGVYPSNGILSKNSYAKNALSQTYPFDILVAGNYKKPGVSGNPGQGGITQYLAEFIGTLKHGKVVLTGYSFGGQATAGFMTNSNNSGKPTHYLGSEIFDAYVIMCGKAPGSQDWQSNKNKPLIIVHGTSDTAVPISNGTNIMNKHNASVPKYVVLPDYKLVSKNGVSSWVKQTVPDTTRNRMVVIVGGGHSSSWNYGYQWFEPGAENNEVRKFIEWVFEEKYVPVLCAAILDERRMTAEFTKPDGTVVKYRLSP